MSHSAPYVDLTASLSHCHMCDNIAVRSELSHPGENPPGLCCEAEGRAELHIRAKFDEAEGRGELCTGD